MKYLVVRIFPTNGKKFEMDYLITPLSEVFLNKLKEYRDKVLSISVETLCMVSFFNEDSKWGTINSLGLMGDFSLEFGDFASILESLPNTEQISFRGGGVVLQFTPTDKDLQCYQIRLNAEGFWFVCNDVDSGEEYSTDRIDYDYVL